MLLLLFCALSPNRLSFPSNEVVGAQCVVPGAAQLELSTEELLLLARLHRQPQPRLPFHPASRSSWPEFNLHTTEPPGPALASLRSGVCFLEYGRVWILFPQVCSLPCLSQTLTKLLFPVYILHISKVICILFLLLELLTIVSKLELLVNSKTEQLLPFFPSRS